MKYILTLIVFSLSFALYSQSIQGRIVSQVDGSTLPFATISFSGTTIGTVSNKDGAFILQVPSGYESPILEISYLGYETRRIRVNNISNFLEIELKEEVLQLADLIVTPLEPTDYIKRAVKKIPENYPTQPFGSLSYYRELFMENGSYINGVEGVFQSYYPSFQDTLDNQHQLVLFRQADDLTDITFAQRWIGKRQEKELKKAKKKGEEAEDFNISEEIREGFGGPENILSMDLSRELEDCLDSTQFKKFRYKLANGVKYRDSDLLVIKFETKRVVDHTRQEGKIFIDMETDAFVAVEYEGVAVIPVVVRPLLFAFGLGIENPKFQKKLTYQKVGDKWYPENFQWDVNLSMVKRYTFHKNENSDFFIEQLFKVNEIKLSDLLEVEKEKQFDADDPMSEQVFPSEGMRWSEMNTLIPEKTSDQ